MYPKRTAVNSTFDESVSRLRHDLRNRLNDILGFSEILLEEAGSLGRDWLAHFEEIKESGIHVLNAVDRHLDSQTLSVNPQRVHSLYDTIDSFSLRIAQLAQALISESDMHPLDRCKDDLLRIVAAAHGMLDLARSSLVNLHSEKSRGEQGQPGSMRSAASELTHFSQHAPGSHTVLIVDDDESNRILMSRRLQHHGYQIMTARHGGEALQLLKEREFDTVVLDIVMPEVDGNQVLARMKADERLRHIPVIVISALDDEDNLVRCIERGADDYLTKPFNPVLLRARIHACCEKKQLRDQERALTRRLLGELQEAAGYVQSLLPRPLTGAVTASWRYIPSARLGGDSFDYQWLDETHFALYLVDVCGHGVGAALLSVSVMNALRSRMLPADFLDPAAVLRALNEAFPMEKCHDMFFTIWYGVYDKSDRRMRYASGGHPPAVLLTERTSKRVQAQCLATSGTVIGAIPGAQFRSASCAVDNFCKLFLFSDGVYEITKSDGKILHLHEFVEMLIRPRRESDSDLDSILGQLRALNDMRLFEDDYSMVELVFR